VGYTVLLIAVFVLGWVVFAYNRLVRLKVRATAAWRDIDTQLQRRWDLIPALVETVRGYAVHEQEAFSRVTEARSRAIAAVSPPEQAIAEKGLKAALGSLFAVVEGYPVLRADEGFVELQRTLEEVEDTVQRSRRYYNAVVRDLNSLIEVFPSTIVARVFRFERREFYLLPGEEVREPSRVSLR